MPDPTHREPPDEHVARRLEGLRAEYERGTQLIEQQQAELQETRDQLLRIAGAIRVCEELLGEVSGDA